MKCKFCKIRLPKKSYSVYENYNILKNIKKLRLYYKIKDIHRIVCFPCRYPQNLSFILNYVQNFFMPLNNYFLSLSKSLISVSKISSLVGSAGFGFSSFFLTEFIALIKRNIENDMIKKSITD